MTKRKFNRAVTKFVQRMIERMVTREPVLFFAFIGQIIAAAWSIAENSRWGIVLTAGVTLFQRAYSTAKVTAEENVESAKYVGAIANQAGVPLPPSGVTEASKSV